MDSRQQYFCSGIGIQVVAYCFRWCHTNILGRMPNVVSLLLLYLWLVYILNSHYCIYAILMSKMLYLKHSECFELSLQLKFNMSKKYIIKILSLILSRNSENYLFFYNLSQESNILKILQLLTQDLRNHLLFSNQVWQSPISF